MTTVADTDTDAPATGGASPHIVLWLMIALLGAAFVWAWIGRLDVVATAMGEVVPSTQVKSVQHLEGGIVRDILVREGDRVTAGQALIELDPVRSDADVKSLEGRLADLAVEIARLEAESEGRDTVSFPGDLAVTHPTLTGRATQLFNSRRDRITKKIAVIDQRIAQRENEISAIRKRIGNNENRLKLVREQISISEDLMKDQLTNRMNHLNLLKEQAALEARINEDGSALPRARAAANEARAERAEIKAAHLQEVREQLSEKRRDAREIETNLEKFNDALSRTVLRSPVDGVIKTLHIATIGGVVQPGQAVIDVVPGSDKLVIEAKLPTADIGYVQTGQEVQVTLASSEAIRFGRIRGTVVNVSPDTIEAEDGVPFYKVRVETDKGHFDGDTLKYELVPGVQVTCAIRTGERSVLAYILDPFLSSVQTALRER